MQRLAITLAALMAFAGSLAAQDCSGRDLRSDLSTTQQAELAEMTAKLDFPEGNHWRATKADEVIDIIGTLHVDDPRLDATIETLEPLIENAGLILLEATPKEEERMKDALARDPSLLVVTEGPTLPDLLSDEDWTRLRDAAAARGIPGFMAAKFRPWYLSILLSMPPCMITAMQEGTEGLDKRISQHATAHGIAMASLEEFDTLFRLFAQFDAAQQAEMVTATIPSPGEAENMLASLIEGYFEERHAEVWAFSHYMARLTTDLPDGDIDQIFADLRRIVLTERNAAWMPVIRSAVEQTQGPLIVAAGAAHLSGSDGLLELLAADGWQLEQLAFRSE